MRWENAAGFVADDNVDRVDLDVVHGFLRTAYWSPGVPREVVARAIANSVVIGVYAPDGTQVAFARAVTDRATFAWIADVMVVPSHQGQGLGRFVVSTLLNHPDLQGLRRTMLATADAHTLYRSYGFNNLPNPTRFLAIQTPATTLYAAPTTTNDTPAPAAPADGALASNVTAAAAGGPTATSYRASAGGETATSHPVGTGGVASVGSAGFVGDLAGLGEGSVDERGDGVVGA